MMRLQYAALRRLGRMSEEAATDDQIAHFAEIADHLPVPDTVEEIEVILQSLPLHGETFYGVAWTLLHCLEASPLWLEVAGRYERPTYGPEDEWLETLHRRIANWRSQ